MASDFPPLAIRIWMHKLKKGGGQPAAILERSLLNFMSAEAASLSVANATERGILLPRALGGRAKRLTLTFCQKVSSLPSSTSDPYCFECHLPGVIQKCSSCERSFHEDCQRKDPEKPNYSVPSDKGQPYRFPVNESDKEPENHQIVEASQTPTPKPLLDYNSNINQDLLATPDSLKHESLEWDDDVFFVSEQKGARQRQQARIKDELQTSLDSDEGSDLGRCTRCRLLSLAALHNPPQLDKQELGCLLKYSWEKHHSWITMDVAKYMAKHWNERDKALIKRILFKSKILGLADIERNIEANKYTYLTEFLMHLLDLQHNIAVFFGPKSEEYNATKWLVRDVTHDIREIRRCPDCYRYSNEASLSDLWFAKPCLQRHELVFAKQTGSPPWPAKVMSVSKRQPIKYDVRFFGGSHSRALISERDITPIESDIQSQIKPRSSRALSAALRELQCHMMLSHYSASLFGFHADPATAENLIQVALSHCTESSEAPTTSKRGRPSTPANPGTAKKRRLNPNTPDAPSPVPTRATIPDSVTYDKLTAEILRAHEDLLKCQRKLTAMQQKLDEVKRKQWCYLCLEEAVFDCCFTASYCSGECQRRDKRRHQAICKVNH
ncbi:zinc finger MYND domain-containing protein 11 [Drosophila rhopaloa]|uniref:Zinc finger MYND domain-containing protein 11 n=1 Tax=Drosophila rhopaloa TaxID=1041015 RepID=A0A6P4EFL7_DRORH|nr:zinc finger MYND domain-containing protein 11 [Drosophila rhopaloa]